VIIETVTNMNRVGRTRLIQPLSPLVQDACGTLFHSYFPSNRPIPSLVIKGGWSLPWTFCSALDDISRFKKGMSRFR